MNISSTSVSVTWDPPNNFHGPNEGYQVTYTRLETGTLSTTDRVTDGTSVTITELERYEDYNVTVIAYSNQGSGPPSEGLAIRTAEDCKSVYMN